MNNEPKGVPPDSEWQGLWIGILVIIVVIVSLIDWMVGVTLIPINRFVALLTFAVLILISGILLVFSFKALSPDVAMGRRRSELVTTGIYAHLRHPHYLANTLLSFSIVIFFRSWTGLFSAFCSVPLTYLLTRSEEEYLKRRFGKAYAEYASETPMFIPKIRKRKE